ncbi:type I restriction-modification system endonuclease [uncultured Anaerovibrio sp.]|uniref:type I restriction-modification system endonuclease n=1 Tax=uncultured Anaerovibrio sp. TaxID=361586 RepID=UPI0025FE7079|nr:type I restriction-modification system endonuclease [uncultured Anaerovibrio sp.]
MKSNFSFLETDFPILYKYGCYAEQYLYSDSNSCLFKMGQMGETIINLIFDFDKIELPYPNDASNRINRLRREDLLDEDMAQLFHELRKLRNGAVHKGVDDLEECKRYLPIIHSLAAWFQEVYGTSLDFEAKQAVFVMPSAIAQQQIEDITEDSLEQQLLSEAAHKAKKTKKIALSVRQKKAAQVANGRRKTEAETRLLIDEQLRQVGWEADTAVLRYSKGTRPERGRCIAIAEWPTRSNKGQDGSADYVLFIGLKLVAVIEAKASHKDVSTVIDFQGKQYARDIRPEDEQYIIGTWGEYKVPFTFATNGRPYLEQLKTKSGVWFLDLRKKSNISKPLRGWISPVGFNDLLEKDVEAGNRALQNLSQDLLRDPDGLNLREYQIRAIEEAEKAIISGAQTCLLAMATGTGKTRTILGMIYRFLKTNRFKRILFLVDRNSLGVQAHDVFKDVKLEELMPLEKIYNIKGLDDKLIDRETRVQVTTVQGMIQRILYNDGEEKPAVSDFDLIIIDEAHRGYTLDKMMTEEEISFRDQRDFQSKYRSIIEYFDCVKIALTATPALHTVQIFGEPVFTYSYREAVVDGYLVDHDAPHNITTKLSSEGIKYKKGDSAAIYDPVTGEITNIDKLEDELDFDIDDFNRKVISENFNKVVLEEVAKDINPLDPSMGKTLIYAVNDHHADMIVDILKNIYAPFDVDNDAIMKITGSIENGNQKKIQEAIIKFKNEQFPNIVVTVDLLTTGIDVPKITKLVFLRRVKSRILFEQMLGRATRLCPSINKDHFDIYDGVMLYEAIDSNMKPVTTNPSISLIELIETLEETQDTQEKVLRFQLNQVISKIHRKAASITKEKEEQFANMTGGLTPTQYARKLATMDVVSAKEKLLKDKAVFAELQRTKNVQYVIPVVIDGKEDEIKEHKRGYGTAVRPEDYIEQFTKYVKENQNEVAALNIICTRPSDLTRESLKELLSKLDYEGFTITQLNSAVSAMSNEEIMADIISLVRRYAIGSPLVGHKEKVDKAIKRLKKNYKFTAMQETWIKMIGDYLQKEPIINKAAFEQDSRFKGKGGFKKINELLNDQLDSIISDLNRYMYDDGGEAG